MTTQASRLIAFNDSGALMHSLRYPFTLLFSPFTFFSDFEDNQMNWLPSWLGYFFVAMGGWLGFIGLFLRAVFEAYFFYQMTINGLLGGLLTLVSVGIVWVWGSSRLLGGRARLKSSMKAAGSALLWPGIIASIINFIFVVCASFNKPFDHYVVLFVQFVLILWSFLMLGACVRGLNGFGPAKTLIAVLLLPILAVAIVLHRLIYGPSMWLFRI